MGNMLEINTLSSPEIVVGNEKVDNFVSRKALALVIYLAINPGSRSREELADLLWSDRSQERATGNLRVVLSDIRKKVGDYLSIDRNSVSISASGDIRVDVHQLLDAIETKNLDLAVSLYKGDFLESFYLRGASRFENWQVIEREKIRLELVDGLSERVQSLLKAGKSKEAIKYLIHLTTLEPLLESAHRQLMQAYFENGEVSLALKQFEICKQILYEELSVIPAEETLNLYAHIAQYRSTEKLVSTIPHNLPNFATPFIGQIEKIRELVEILSNPEVKHLSLVGPGGYGKSRLAIYLAKKCIDQFLDGVFWVPLQALKESSEIPTRIADAIGFIYQAEKDIKSELLDYLGSRQTLLVLDNFEHLTEGGAWFLKY
jgi:DNA-binding SARP family transcriptional activator